MKLDTLRRTVRCACAAWSSRAIGLTWIVTVIVLILAVTEGSASDRLSVPVRLDFGTASSPVYDDYDRVTASTYFDGVIGWLDQPLIEERDRGSGNSLLRDFVFGRETAVLRMAVPDGEYLVTLSCGDSASPHPAFAIKPAGRDAFEVPALNAGQDATVTFVMSAVKGVLDIEFVPISDLWLVNSVTVETADAGNPSEPRYRLSGTRTWYPAPPWAGEQPAVRRLRVVKQPAYGSPTYPDLSDYMRVLERFPLFAERGWHPNYRGLEDVGYFGDGDHGEMGLRSMGNFIFTCALLASDPAYDPRPTGVSQEKLLEYARQCLRYMTRSHVTGDLTCADGYKWGDHWQSAWWTGKMAAGARLIWDKLSIDERAAVERVIVHEADRHLPRTAPGGAISNTRSEENAWDTEAMAAALSLFPEHPNAPRWWRKLQEFAMNTLSAPQDRYDTRLVDRRPVNRWVYTENIHSDFTIENHGAYHFCYMACPLHSFAWDWHALISSGQPVPQALSHHVKDVYDVIRLTFLFDGRFAYLAGKDWPRYAYGLYFIMPALVRMEYETGDADARLMEKLRFRTFEREQIMNRDGTFYGRRFTRNRMLSRPLEYETDTYANLGLCYLIHKHFDTGGHRTHSRAASLSMTSGRNRLLTPSESDDFQRRMSGTLVRNGSAWVIGRSPKVFTGWSWRDLGGAYPMGHFIPAGCDDMAEWGREQLAGSFDIKGSDPKKREVVHYEREFDDGFSTVGTVTLRSKDGLDLLRQDIAFISLPNDGIAVLFDRGVAASNITVTSQEGLKFYLANDIFNGGRRTVSHAGGAFTIWGAENTGKTTPGDATRSLDVPWVCVDGRLSFVSLTSNAAFVVRDLRGRSAPWGSLEYDMIDMPYVIEPHEYHANGLVRYSVILLAACDAREAERISSYSRLVATGSPDVQCALVSADGKRCRLVTVNFGNARADVSIEVAGEQLRFAVEPRSADLRTL